MSDITLILKTLEAKDYISLIALVLNVIVFVFTILLNVLIFNRRRDNERHYQNEFNLYDKLLIEQLSELIDFASNVEKILLKLIEKSGTTVNEGKLLRPVIEKGQTILDNTKRTFNREVVTIVACYSPQFRNDIVRLITEFYDNTTIILTGINATIITAGKENEILKNFTEIKSFYLTKLIVLIRHHRPRLN